MGSGNLPEDLEVWPEVSQANQLIVCIFLEEQAGFFCNGAARVWWLIVHVNSGAQFSQTPVCVYCEGMFYLGLMFKSVDSGSSR